MLQFEHFKINHIDTIARLYPNLTRQSETDIVFPECDDLEQYNSRILVS